MPNSTNAVRLQLPEDFSEAHFFQAFAHRLKVNPIETRHLTFWDTFEWGVWFGNCLLYSKEKQFSLCRRDDGWIGSEWCGEEIATARPKFAQDFKALKGRLAGLLGLRGLTPILNATFKQRMTELRNETDKIVCRVELIEATTGKPSKIAPLRYCRILPLLGYEEEVAPVVEVLAHLGAKQSVEGPLDLLLRNAGMTPRPYTLRPHFALDWEDSARPAISRILQAILMIARGNEQGICSDIDTEFLHHYRICIRKIRSVLGLIDGIYPVEETARIRTLLGDLARATNPLRDLDVYLLARKDYSALLPAAFQPALNMMFTDFEHERSSALQQIIAHLRSASRVRLMEKLDLFFREVTPHPASSASELPVGPLVFGRIYKRYRKIRKLTNELAQDAPEEVMHDLRIQCKKLRYLMEFFSELIPKEAATALEKPLKQLQNRLGELHDASVQQKFLLDYWEQKKRKSGKTDMALSLGGLISVLNYRQLEHRKKIQEALTTFRSATTADLFKQTFRLIPESTDEMTAS